MMAEAGKARPRRPRGWTILLAAAVVYAAMISVIVAYRAESTSDFRDFWENAVRFRETGEIASDLGVHNYLPFFTIFMLPWGFLPLQVAIVVFSLLSLALFGVTVVLVEHLLHDGFGRQPRPALLIALGLMLPYVHSCAVLGNVGLLLLFLIVTAWFFVERGREWEAGAALGLAALIKLLPGLLLVYFLLKRRWRVAGAAAGVIVVFGFGLPVLALGYRQTVALHSAFYERAVRQGSAAETLTAAKPVKMFYSNNALPTVLRRLLSPVDAGKDGEQSLVNVADLSPQIRLGVYLALLAVFLGASLAGTLHGRRHWPPESLDDGRAVRSQFGVWCCVMLLASPLVWTHYLPLAYWPLALLADRVERTWRAQRICRISVATLTIWLVGALLLAWPTARAAGAQIASVGAIWLGLVWLTLRRE
jgi:hypothetical protein